MPVWEFLSQEHGVDTVADFLRFSRAFQTARLEVQKSVWLQVWPKKIRVIQLRQIAKSACCLSIKNVAPPRSFDFPGVPWLQQHQLELKNYPMWCCKNCEGRTWCWVRKNPQLPHSLAIRLFFVYWIHLAMDVITFWLQVTGPIAHDSPPLGRWHVVNTLQELATMGNPPFPASQGSQGTRNLACSCNPWELLASGEAQRRFTAEEQLEVIRCHQFSTGSVGNCKHVTKPCETWHVCWCLWFRNSGGGTWCWVYRFVCCSRVPYGTLKHARWYKVMPPS